MTEWYNTVKEALAALSPPDRKRYVGSMWSAGRCQVILAPCNVFDPPTPQEKIEADASAEAPRWGMWPY